MIIRIDWLIVSFILGSAMGMGIVWTTRHKEHLTAPAIAGMFGFFLGAMVLWGALDGIETFEQLDKIATTEQEK